MSKLLNFPQIIGGRAEAPAPAAPSAPTGDWSQQELADLYRVEALLVQANMRIETQRGTTDEDEPWFVFCRQDGEVFVHLCRIDGAYLLDSPGLDAPLRGADFPALIGLFIKNVAARAASSNVVQFRKARQGDVVRLHPALMMAALIWSLYLASDHLIEAAHAAEMDLNAEAGGLRLSEPGDAEAAEAELNALVERMDGKHAPDAPASPLARAHEEARGLFGGQAVAAGIAAALTVIAVTYGLHEQRQIDIELVANSSAEGSQPTGSHGHGALDIVVAELPRSDAPAGHEGTLASPDDGLVAISAEPILLSTNAIIGTVQTALAGLANVDWVTLNSSEPAVALPASPVVETVRFDTAGAVSAPVMTLKAGAPQASQRTASDANALLALAEKHLGTLSSFDVGGKTIAATFDVSSFKFAGKEVLLGGDLITVNPAKLTLAPSAPELIAGPVVADAETVIEVGPALLPEPLEIAALPGGTSLGKNTGLATYDSFAKAFIQNFMLKSSSVEMVKRDNALFLIDTTAVDDVHDRYVSKSWIVDDSMVVTAVGHYQDFLYSGLLFI